MSERKVLNKYYPPDFDPSKIPRMKLPKNRQYTVRLMAPFNMRCATCGEYIYKGKKFNARKEDVENETYLGIRIYRFYIKCTRCLQEISFKTDPKSTDYEIEAGATRNFMALKLAEEQAVREEEEAKEEEASNPMKLLENRTKQSKNEIELLESLEELKDLNKRQQAVDYDTMLVQYDTTLTQREKEEKLKQMDEDYIKTVKFQSTQKRKMIVEEEIIDDDDDDDDDDEPIIKSSKLIDTSTDDNANTPVKITNTIKTSVASSLSWQKSIGGFSSRSTKSTLAGLVKIKPAVSAKLIEEEKPSIKQPAESNEILSKPSAEISKGIIANGLSLLGAYSDSESNSD